MPAELWTIKELFCYPNEQIYWSLLIVMYPFITGLVAGAFVLSSFYHVFKVKELKDIARFSLVFSLSLLLVAPLPLLLHISQPARSFYVFLTPHLSSPMSAFGFVFAAYGLLVCAELWFMYRLYFVQQMLKFKELSGALNRAAGCLYSALALGAFHTGGKACRLDEKACSVLAALGIPLAFLLHGYVGFIFSSIKGSVLWFTPLMPLIFIASAVVSGFALSLITFTACRKIMEKAPSTDKSQIEDPIEGGFIRRFLFFSLLLTVLLEMSDLMCRCLGGGSSAAALRELIYRREFIDFFVLQFGIGSLFPLLLLLLPGATRSRIIASSVFILFGAFMMRWNIVIGGQSISHTSAGYLDYVIPVIPHDLLTLKDGWPGAVVIAILPFLFLWALSRVFPLFLCSPSEHDVCSAEKSQ